MGFSGISLILICFFVFLGLVQSPSLAKTITVDQTGHADFNTIQSAINSIPPRNTQWIRILVRGNTYREQVKITSDKQFIMLEGDGVKRTTISWNSSTDLINSASFSALADNFVVKSIRFECDNISALSLASNPVCHARTKHVEIDYHFIREKVLNKELRVRFVASLDQTADIFTKGLSAPRFKFLQGKLQVRDRPISLKGHHKDNDRAQSDPQSPTITQCIR